MNTLGPSGYVGQTYTVEYTVPGSLDGSTLGPAIVVPAGTDDPQQIYRPVVEGNLGLIDVDYVVEESGDERLGARGPRIVNVVWLESPVIAGDPAVLQVVDNVDGSPVSQNLIASLVGLVRYYRDTPFLVPQGSMLRISGFTNPGPTPIRLRLTIQYVDDLTAAQQALCGCSRLKRSIAVGSTGSAGTLGLATIASSGSASDLGTGTVPVARLPVASTTTVGAVELATDGEALANVAVQGNDSRLSNARTPTAHAASHVTGGADVIATFGAATAGLVPASGGGTTTFLRADGTFEAPPGGGGGLTHPQILARGMGA